MMQKTKTDWWHSINQVLVMFGVGLGFGIFGPSLIDLAEIYETTAKEIAIMNSARAVGMFVGSCIGGFFYNTINDQIVTLLFLIIYGVGTVLIPMLPNTLCLHICGSIAGVAFGISHIGSQVRLVKIWPEQSASAIQAFHGAYGVGSMVGPFVVAPFLSQREDTSILQESQLYIPYAAFGIFYLLMSISMLAAYFVDPTAIKKNNKDTEDKIEQPKNNSEMLLMTLLFIYLTTCVNTEHTYGTFVSVYTIGSPSLHFTKSEAAYLAGTYWSAFTGGRIISIFLAAFLDLRQLLIMSHSFVIGGSALLIAFSDSELCAWIGTVVMGVGVSSMYGTASGHVFEFIHLRHSHVGAILAASCLGIAISSYAVPPFVEMWPMFLQYYVGAGNVFHAIVLAAVFLATKGKEKVYVKEEKSQDVQKEGVIA